MCNVHGLPKQRSSTFKHVCKQQPLPKTQCKRNVEMCDKQNSVKTTDTYKRKNQRIGTQHSREELAYIDKFLKQCEQHKML